MKSFTQVDGSKVVEAQQAQSALSKPGKPVYFTGTQELLLEDGRVVYGCIWCGAETNPQIGKLRLHQRYQCPDRPASERKPAKKKQYPPWTQKPEVQQKKAAQDRRVTRPDVFGTSAAIPATSVRREPPPSGASDILAALRGVDPSADELVRSRKTVQTLSHDMTQLIRQRDEWKKKYEGLEAEMNKIRALLKERGLL